MRNPLMETAFRAWHNEMTMLHLAVAVFVPFAMMIVFRLDVFFAVLDSAFECAILVVGIGVGCIIRAAVLRIKTLS